jgi:hypothetical protein
VNKHLRIPGLKNRVKDMSFFFFVFSDTEFIANKLLSFFKQELNRFFRDIQVVVKTNALNFSIKEYL